MYTMCYCLFCTAFCSQNAVSVVTLVISLNDHPCTFGIDSLDLMVSFMLLIWKKSGMPNLFLSVASKSTRSTYSLKEVLAHQILQWQFYLVWADQEQLKIATTGTLVDLFLALYLVTKDSKSGSPKWDTILLIHSIKDSESLC